MVPSKCLLVGLSFAHSISMMFLLIPLLFSVSAAVNAEEKAAPREPEQLTTKEVMTPSSASQEKDRTLNPEDFTISPPSIPDIVGKEQAPPFTFPVWDDDGHLCILSKFFATFMILYPSQGGEQTVSVNLPDTVNTKGRCSTSKQEPALELSWPGFRLSMIFTKVPSKNSKAVDNWIIRSIELLYNTKGPLFDGATNAGKKTARSEDNITQFETAIGKSYFCPSPEVIPMYGTKDNKVATARLQDVQIQPYAIQKGAFSQIQRCNQVRIGGMPEPFAQDETVPIAVGSTLAVLAVIVVLGYALHRSMAVRKVDYNTME